MNIKKAKQQIINSVKAYLAKDEHGRYLIPQNKQRPLFLIGPPGIGKTEIMAQAASELGIGLLSYSMTHHTRQSALGLPLIKQKEYKGECFDVSEYTMSDILSSVYTLMENSGVENGILFLDEINCVSETLTPIMLQFLQYKVFGGHKLPEGWIVVTAGNPPEYNNSVKDFDIVTWDRLKRIDVSPDISAWKEFAYSGGIHGAVITYLEIKPQNFYKIETSVNGKSFVTARGWDDLSRALSVYEKLGIEVDGELIGQYIQNSSIASDFFHYYELYNKYKSDYKISEILAGAADKTISDRAKKARFDERYSLLGLLLEDIGAQAKCILEENELLTLNKSVLEQVKREVSSGKDGEALLENAVAELEQSREKLRVSGGLSQDKEDMLVKRISSLKRFSSELAKGGFEQLKQAFGGDVEVFKSRLKDTKEHFSNMFAFCESAFGSGQELLILITELAANPVTARYISAFGCSEYYKHDKSLMLYERQLEIIDELDKLEADMSASDKK